MPRNQAKGELPNSGSSMLFEAPLRNERANVGSSSHHYQVEIQLTPHIPVCASEVTVAPFETSDSRAPRDFKRPGKIYDYSNLRSGGQK